MTYIVMYVKYFSIKMEKRINLIKKISYLIAELLNCV